MTDPDTSRVRLTIAFLDGTIQFLPEPWESLSAIDILPGYEYLSSGCSERREFEATLGLLSAISRYFCALNPETF